MKDTKKVGEHFYLILHVCMGRHHTRRVNIQKKERPDLARGKLF